MTSIKTDSYPVYVNQEEAGDLCIQEGWYIGGAGSFAANGQTGNPFGSEKEVIEYIENSALDDLHTSA